MPEDLDWTAPRPVRRIEPVPDAPLAVDAWPSTVPAVAQLLRDGLDLGRATVLVGENGSGKSTVVEGVAMAYGMNGEGGSTGRRARPTRASRCCTGHSTSSAGRAPVDGLLPAGGDDARPVLLPRGHARGQPHPRPGVPPDELGQVAVVDHYRRFLDAPMRNLRHVLP